jgi:hypothetical protein
MSTAVTHWLRVRQRHALAVVGAVPIAAITFVQDVRDGRVLPIASDVTEANTLLLVGAFGDAAADTIRQLRQRMVVPGQVVWLAPEEPLLCGSAWQSIGIDVVVRGLPPTEAALADAWQQLEAKA